MLVYKGMGKSPTQIINGIRRGATEHADNVRFTLPPMARLAANDRAAGDTDVHVPAELGQEEARAAFPVGVGVHPVVTSQYSKVKFTGLTQNSQVDPEV